MALLPPAVSPVRAINDLRRFLAHRQKHELIFAFLAVFLTSMTLVGFYLDSKFEKPWKRDIQYFESWPANRTDEQIRAQQAIDLVKKRELEARLEARKQERMRQFQKLDRQLDDMGL